MSMNYCFSIPEGNCIYSVDMLYMVGYLTESFNTVFEHLKSVSEESKFYKGRSAYCDYQNMFKLNGVSFYLGRFDSFDAVSREWSVVPMAMIRFNPNKTCIDSVNPLIDYFCSVTHSRYLQKYDIACDVPCKPENIVVASKRSYGCIDSGVTRYYGSVHSDIRYKIYDKALELTKSDKSVTLDTPLTRIELTIKGYAFRDLIESDTELADRFYLVDELNKTLSESDSLNDTDKAILTMFFRLRMHEPMFAIEELFSMLGRKKAKKLKDILSTSSPSRLACCSVAFSRECIKQLLGLVSSRFDCTIYSSQKQLFNELMSDFGIL